MLSRHMAAADPHPILFIPGPTEVLPELRQILSMPLMGHRSKEFVACVQDVCRSLRRLFLTEAHTAFETCPATAMMEASLRNFVPHQGLTLHLVGGAFASRWAKISKQVGRSPEVLEAPWGQAHDPAQLQARLAAEPQPAAVCITHNETSTGVLQPLQELAATVRRHAPNAVILVDSVTSLAGAELRFDDWQLDFAFAGSQKCLALAPGVTSYAVSNRAMELAAAIPERGFLFDFCKAVPDTNAGKTLATPCVPLVFALRRQLQRILDEEGLENRWRRHTALKEQTLDWAEAHGFRPFVERGEHRSPTVSCLAAGDRSTATMAERALAAGYRMDQGYGDLKGKAFRIGHMGDHTQAELQRLLDAIG
jgi:aspartate aminotransferase-like enzyme